MSATHVTIQIEPLENTAEYSWLKGLKSVLLYDTVKAYDERIGLEMTLYVSEWEYDFVKEKISGLKLSNVQDFGGRTVTGYNVQNNSIGADKLTDGAKRELIQSAVDVMPEYANPGSGTGAKPNTKDQDGYVLKGGTNYGKVWKTDSSGVPAWRDEDAPYKVTESLTTNSSGYLTYDLEFEKFVTCNVSSAIFNYAFARKAANGKTIIQIFDSSFNPVANATVSVDIWRTK